MKTLLITAVAGAFLLVSPAFADAPASPPNAPVVSADDSLYKQFGGHDGLVKIMDDLFVNIGGDSRIASFFPAEKIPHIKAMLVEQVCQVTGGGCTYSGKDMKAVHGQLGITQEDFYALVEDLEKAMDKNNVPESAQNRLLAALAPQSRVIIYKETPENAAAMAATATKPANQ